ncbi:PLP-dependent transferase, partial [Marasmius fiardii PR-910]
MIPYSRITISMDIEQFRKEAYKAIDQICDYHYALREAKIPVVSSVEPGYLRPLLPPSAPQTGQDFSLIAADYQKLIVPGYTPWQHPSFFAYFPTGFSFEGLIGDIFASSACNPGFNWTASPSCTELETVVMDWAAQMLGLDPVFYNSSGVGGGCLQNTASEAALIAVIAARQNYMDKHPEAKLDELIIYVSTQTHSLGMKAALILGLQLRAIEVRFEDNFALKGDALRSAIKEDTKAGKRPFILIATVGTTSSGAIDDLPEIGEVVKDYPDLKIHVDSAWLGVVLACPEFREMCYLNEINKIADSFCTNFHKWGLTNFDASTMWVRDRKYLTEALDITPVFLRTPQGEAGTVIEYRNWHLGLGRRYRSVKLWFVLRGFGVEGFQAYLRKTISLNKSFIQLVQTSAILKTVVPPSFSLTVFRLIPKPQKPDEPPVPEETLNELNQLLYGRLNARKDIILTQTSLNGTSCIRFAVGSIYTEEEHVKQAFNVITQEANRTLEAWRQRVIGET